MLCLLRAGLALVCEVLNSPERALRGGTRNMAIFRIRGRGETRKKHMFRRRFWEEADYAPHCSVGGVILLPPVL